MSEFGQESTDWTGKQLIGACGSSVLISYDGAIDEMEDFPYGYDVECI